MARDVNDILPRMRILPLSLVVLLAPIAAACWGATAPAPSASAASDSRMQAVVVSAGRIQLREVARPLAGTGQVLVKLRYAAVNPGDWKMAGGAADDPAAGAPVTAAAAAAASIDPAAMPTIPGVDGAGVITAVGAGVVGYHIGDAVIVWSQARGTYAQYVAVPADTITLKPDRLSFAEAAGMAHAALAAWNLLLDVAQLRAGQTLLVLGGAGGVGSAAVQIARIKGARVIATASARNADYLKGLGASTVIDYGAQHFEDQLRAIDVALDTVDIDDAYRALAVLRRGGRLVSSVGLPSAAQCAARMVTCQRRTLTGTPPRLVLGQIAAWSQSGLFKVNIDRSFELTEVPKAWQYSQAGHTRGKSVIRITE
jgi:NADPH:quinone reductase-like Zn-dependent oxidoreductase